MTCFFNINKGGFISSIVLCKMKMIAKMLFLMSFATVFTVSAQGVRITGTVSDNFGDVLPGVAVVVLGANIGTSTDINGEFSITVPNDDAILEFTFLGFQTQEVVVGNRRIIAVTMAEAASEIGEVQVVAFGRQRRESVVASIETVNVKDLQIASSNLTTAFAGRIPGLISYSTTGEPGADNAQFFIRGVTTFGYMASPLILIDGFEATQNDLARLMPDDIESFSILKDASATVLYGARGANGIIMVTTKGGQEGPVRISARVDVNVSTPTRLLELLDGVEYMRLYNQALVSRFDDQVHDINTTPVAPWYSETKIRATERGDNPLIYPNIDWYDMLFKRSTVNTRANLSLSGGGAIANYYVSMGFDNQTGLLKVNEHEDLSNFNNNININRFSLRSNVAFILSRTTRLDTRIHGSFQRYNGPFVPASNIFHSVMDSNPVDFPAVWTERDEHHQHVRWTMFGNADPMKTNPYAMMVSGYREENEANISINATLLQDLDFITPELKFTFRASASNWNKATGERFYNPVYYALEQHDPITDIFTLYNLTPDNTPYLNDVFGTREGNTEFYFEARFNWARTWDRHTVGLMTVGTHSERILTSGLGGSIYYTLPERNLGNSGRASYDFDSRYFIEFAYGYNGSEKFKKGRRFGFFPSIGGGWILSNEPFYGENLKNTLSLVKFKITHGRAGNDAVAGRSGRFFYLSEILTGGGTYQFGQHFVASHPGFTTLRYANDDITWEISTKTNIGAEIAFLRGEPLRLHFDVFRDLRSNIYMMRQNFPATAGFQVPIHGNVGKVESRGFDGSLDYRHFFNNQFWVTSRANLTFARNKFIELDEKNYREESRRRVGKPINQPWGLIAERLFVDQLEIENSPRQEFGAYMRGDIKYMDVTGDNIVNQEDEVAIGFPTVPEVQYGFGLSTGYKDFDFSFFFQGNARVSFFINPRGIAPFENRRNAPKIVARDSWTTTNPDVHAFWPRLDTSPNWNNVAASTWWLRDGSFMRLKTVEAGYNLPRTTTERLGLSSMRVYFSGENLFIVSRFKLWDPEMGGNGLAYPINRRFNVGCQISF